MLLTKSLMGDTSKNDSPIDPRMMQSLFYSLWPISIPDGKALKNLRRVELTSHKYKDFYRFLKNKNYPVSIKKDKLIIDLKNLSKWRFQLLRKPYAWEKRPSFLIDYLQIPFVEIKRMIEEKYGPKPKPQHLAAFTWDYIEKKLGLKGQDPASFVAKYRSGDTTEHGSFLTALLRLYDYPAHLTYGYVKVQFAGRHFLAGMTWCEYYDKNRWKRLDPMSPLWRPFDKGSVNPIYLPLFDVVDESIEYKDKIQLLHDRAPSKAIFL